MTTLSLILSGLTSSPATMPAGGYQTRPATRGEKALVAFAAFLTVAAPVFGLVTSLLR